MPLKHRDQAGQPFPPNKSIVRRAFWENVDWSKRTVELIIELGKSKDQIAYWRKVLGKPKALQHGKWLKPNLQKIRAEQRRQIACHLYETECKTYADVGARMGISTASVPHLINSKKFLARTKLGKAIETGKIKKSETCQSCSNPHHRLHGHHEDYSKPFDVIWLCPKCHGALHWVMNRMGTPTKNICH